MTTSADRDRAELDHLRQRLVASHAALLLAMPCMLSAAMHLIESKAELDDNRAPIPGSLNEWDSEIIINPAIAVMRAAEACIGKHWRAKNAVLGAPWFFEILDGTREL